MFHALMLALLRAYVCCGYRDDQYRIQVRPVGTSDRRLRQACKVRSPTEAGSPDIRSPTEAGVYPQQYPATGLSGVTHAQRGFSRGNGEAALILRHPPAADIPPSILSNGGNAAKLGDKAVARTHPDPASQGSGHAVRCARTCPWAMTGRARTMRDRPQEKSSSGAVELRTVGFAGPGAVWDARG
jgi:hypothetical protein